MAAPNDKAVAERLLAHAMNHTTAIQKGNPPLPVRASARTLYTALVGLKAHLAGRSIHAEELLAIIERPPR